MTECMAVMEEEEMAALLVKSAENITGRVAGLELECMDAPGEMKKESGSLFIHTAGDYAATIIMQAEDSFLLELTKRMKRTGTAEAGEAAVYATEFFNILCGYFISHLNSRLHVRARFGIPEYVKGCYEEQTAGSAAARLERIFRCPYGMMRLEGVNLPISR